MRAHLYLGKRRNNQNGDFCQSITVNICSIDFTLLSVFFSHIPVYFMREHTFKSERGWFALYGPRCTTRSALVLPSVLKAQIFQDQRAVRLLLQETVVMEPVGSHRKDS